MSIARFIRESNHLIDATLLTGCHNRQFFHHLGGNDKTENRPLSLGFSVKETDEAHVWRRLRKYIVNLQGLGQYRYGSRICDHRSVRFEKPHEYHRNLRSGRVTLRVEKPARFALYDVLDREERNG